MTRNNWTEPDDGYDSEKCYRPDKTWEDYERERDEQCRHTWPGLFEMLDEMEVRNGERSR